MHPERPREGPARCWRRPADSAPRGGLSTGLLQGLVQIARPPSLPLYLLPRVHAADAEAAQPVQMPTSPTPPLDPGPRPELQETGWDRIKDLFTMDESHRYPEELMGVIKGGLAAALIGMVYGGLPAGRHARNRFIQLSQAEIYTSRVDAVRSAHNAAIRGFVRYGWRWSWRVAAFVTVFNSVSTGISVYRDQYNLSHYAVAGAVTGGLFRLNLGLRGLVAGSVLGAAMGVPTGALILGMQKLAGETARDRRKKERGERYELRLAEWTARLKLTDDLIEDLSVAANAEETNEDVHRIQELLSQPMNEDTAQDSDSQ